MNRVVRLPCKAGEERVALFWEHDDLHTLLGGGPITFVGAIDDLRIVAVGKKMGGATNLPPPNPWCKDPSFFEEDVRGDVILAYSGEEGERGDVDVDALDEWFLQQSLMI